MSLRKGLFLLLVLILPLIAACSPAPEIQASYDPASLQFDGDRAFAIEEEFVTRFINRHSGTNQSRHATEWLRGQLTAAGWTCYFDDWEVINYSRPVPLRNVVCRLPGESAHDPREILVVAHHDQAPTTIQGADNDGSGIAILLHLAEVFGSEGPPKYTLVFVCTDAEEYGMIGSRRYIQTHSNTENIIAGLSLDNLGRDYYYTMLMEVKGQFRGYAPIWIALAAREAAREADGLWDVNLRVPLDQVLDQAVPISFTDQGPMVAVGVSAIGLAGGLPPEHSDEHYQMWHDPGDTIERQSSEALGQSGAVTEATIRQLLSMDVFPKESGPYLYFDESQQVLRGAPLYVIFIGFVALFFLGSYFTGEGSLQERLRHWLGVLPHFLSLWLPLVASILLLYLFVAVGIMDEYHLYPATTKDPALLNPRWPVVLLFLTGLCLFYLVGRRLVRALAGHIPAPEAAHAKSFAFLVIGLACIYVLVANPFSLLFFVPLLFWFLIRGWRGIGRIFDIIMFLLGGLMVYALIYEFGFQILRINFVFLWMLMIMLSIDMISFAVSLASTAIIAAGLGMIVNPPQ